MKLTVLLSTSPYRREKHNLDICTALPNNGVTNVTCKVCILSVDVTPSTAATSHNLQIPCQILHEPDIFQEENSVRSGKVSVASTPPYSSPKDHFLTRGKTRGSKGMKVWSETLRLISGITWSSIKFVVLIRAVKGDFRNIVKKFNNKIYENKGAAVGVYIFRESSTYTPPRSEGKAPPSHQNCYFYEAPLFILLLINVKNG